jgi:hypothetical protein
MKKGRGTSMFWKPRDWKRAVQELRKKYRSWIGELFSAVAKEENRIARMESDGHLESNATGMRHEDET